MTKVIRLSGKPAIEVPIEAIELPKDALRVKYEGEEGELVELGQSMLAEGQMNPISVFDLGNGRYRCVTGDRRLRGAIAVQATTVWISVIEPRDEVATICFQIGENVQRKQLDPYEEADAYQRLLKLGLSIGEIAQRVKRREGKVREILQFATAASGVHELVVLDKLAPSKAAMIARLPDGEDQVRVAEIVVEHGLTGPQTRELVEKTRNEPHDGKPRRYLSPEKTIAEAARVVRWLHRVAAETHFRSFTAKDCAEWREAFSVEMTSALKLVNDCIQKVGKSVPNVSNPGMSSYEGNVPRARNHGDEWPASDVRKVEDWMRQRVRKPIAVLAQELGRTVSAVRELQKRLREKRRA